MARNKGNETVEELRKLTENTDLIRSLLMRISSLRSYRRSRVQ